MSVYEKTLPTHNNSMILRSSKGYNKLCFIFLICLNKSKLSKNQKSMLHKLSEHTVLLTTRIKLKYLLDSEYHFR